MPGKSGRFIRIAPLPANGSVIDDARITALYGTAFLAAAVLGEQGISTSVADEIAAWLQPDPSGRAAWAPRHVDTKGRRRHRACRAIRRSSEPAAPGAQMTAETAIPGDLRRERFESVAAAARSTS